MAAHGHNKESSDPIDLLGDCSGCLPTRVAPLQKPPQRRRFRFETLAEPQPSSFSTRTEPWSGDMLEKARTAGVATLSRKPRSMGQYPVARRRERAPFGHQPEAGY